MVLKRAYACLEMWNVSDVSLPTLPVIDDINHVDPCGYQLTLDLVA
jgi:hypothetical protein